MEFDITAGARLLESFGVLQRDGEDNLRVLSIDAVLRCLPRQPVSIVSREAELDLEEGYDREMFENEDDYKKEERRNSKRGWL